MIFKKNIKLKNISQSIAKMEDMIMNQLSHEELCLLEQLTYLDEEVAAAAGVNDVFVV